MVRYVFRKGSATQFVELATEFGDGHFSRAGTIGQPYRTKVGTVHGPRQQCT